MVRTLHYPLRKTLVPLLAALLLTSACGVNQEALARIKHANEGDALAEVSITYDAMQDPYAVQLTRVEGGYAMEAPMYQTSDTHARVTLSRTNNYSWFIGPNLSFSF